MHFVWLPSSFYVTSLLSHTKDKRILKGIFIASNVLCVCVYKRAREIIAVYIAPAKSLNGCQV